MIKIVLDEKHSVAIGRLVYMLVESKNVKDTELFSFDNWIDFTTDVNKVASETGKEVIQFEIDPVKKTTTITVVEDVDVLIKENIDAFTRHLSRLLKDIQFCIEQKERLAASLKPKEGNGFLSKLKFWGDD